MQDPATVTQLQGFYIHNTRDWGNCIIKNNEKADYIALIGGMPRL